MDDDGYLAASQPGMDWSWLLATADRHAVTPLLARRLSRHPAGAPPHILAALREKFDTNALRNLALARQLAELLQRLGELGVAAVPIKGPVLALSAYGDLTLREFADLDIVVHPDDFGRARSLFGEWGYRPLAALTSVGERALRSSDHHLPLVNQKERVVVELHWMLGRGRLGRDNSWVWGNMRPLSILGLEVPTLSWSALLVYLCVHGAGHGWARLGWIRDVAGVLSAAPAGQLHTAGELAAAVGARRRLALGVTLAHELLGAPVREELDRRLRGNGGGVPSRAGRSVAELAAEVRSRLFAHDTAGLARWVAFQCRTREKVLDRARYCLYILAAPHVADVEAVKLPGWLRGLYYVVRPARLVARRARALRAARLTRQGRT